MLKRLRGTPGIVAKAAGLAAIGCLACLVCMQLLATTSSSRVLLGVAGTAFALGMAAWVCAAAVVLVIEIAVSLGGLGELIRAAIVSASPAAWFAPAFLLLRSGMLPLAGAVGLVLVGNTARLLFSRVSPKKLRRKRVIAGPEDVRTMFALVSEHVPAGSRSTPGLVAALAIHLGALAFFSDWPFAAALLIGSAAAVWTRSSVRRGACSADHNVAVVRLVWNVVPAILAAILILLVPPVPAAAGPAGADSSYLGDDILEIARRMVANHAGKALPNRTRTTLVPPTKAGARGLEGIPGVVLRSRSNPPDRSIRVGPGSRVAALTLAQPFTLPYTEEYRIFRHSSGSLPPGSPIEWGTPLHATYVATNRTRMVVEAWQPLRPPLDLTNCGKIRLTLRSREELPALVSMDVMIGSAVVALGEDAFGTNDTSEETVEFQVPPSVRPPASAIRVRFQIFLLTEERSARVEVLRFSFVPRGL